MQGTIVLAKLHRPDYSNRSIAVNFAATRTNLSTETDIRIAPHQKNYLSKPGVLWNTPFAIEHVDSTQHNYSNGHFKRMIIGQES